MTNLFLDYTGDLEIVVNYGGENLLKAYKKNVKGDHLVHAIDILNGSIVSSIEKMFEKMSKAVEGNYTFKDFTDQVLEEQEKERKRFERQ